MNVKFRENFLNYRKALKNLKAALKEADTDLAVDGTIKRFELCYELSWKLIKEFLSERGIICMSPRECFKAAKQNDLIDDELRWLKMIEDRNYLIHTYTFDQSRSIYQSIRKQYVKSFDHLKKQFDLHLGL